MQPVPQVPKRPDQMDQLATAARQRATRRISGVDQVYDQIAAHEANTASPPLAVGFILTFNTFSA